MGGIHDVLEILEARGQWCEPEIYKHLDGSKYEQWMFQEIPSIMPEDADDADKKELKMV